jgi:hypothetical protein
MAQTQLGNEELARRRQELYETRIRGEIEDRFDGKILAIDVETGAYEIDDDVLTAVHRIQEKFPGDPIYTMRIGYSGVYGFGGGPRRVKQ